MFSTYIDAFLVLILDALILKCPYSCALFSKLTEQNPSLTATEGERGMNFTTKTI